MKNGRRVSRQVDTVTSISINHGTVHELPNVSLSPEVSVLITKFTCQLGSRSTVGALSGPDFFLFDKWELGVKMREK